MMNETDEMRQARHALHALSASDPAACTNMLRHVAAYSLMVTGHRGRDRRGDEPQVVAGFVLTHGAPHVCGEAVRQNGIDTIYVAFDVDDAAGPPVAAGVFRKDGDDVVVYGDCRLWSPANDGRALLVPMGPGRYPGYLTFRTGRPLELVHATVPGDVDAGFRRAQTRMRRLLASEAVRRRKGDGYLHCVQTVGGRLSISISRAAA